MQRIEFYQAEFRPVRVTLPLSRIVAILAGVVIILGAVAAYQHWMLGKLEKELATISALDKKQQDIVAKMAQSVGKMQVSPALEAQAGVMRDNIANQERLLTILRQQSDTHKVSFSSFLQGFMDHHQEGVALERFRIEEAGTLLTLEGAAMNAALIPRYIDGLKQADMLQGVGFSVFEVKRQEVGGVVRFQVSSRGKESEKAP